MKKRILAVFIAAALCFAFGGCFGQSEEPSEENSSGTAEEELVLYHNSTALAPMLTSLAEEYSSATGKKLSIKQGGSDLLGEIRSNGGAIFLADSHSDLSDWHEAGVFGDLMNDSSLSALPNVAPGLQLNPAGIGSYGVPVMLEGFGYIFDKELLGSLFEEGAGTLIEDLRSCSFTEFEGFVAAVDSYIAAPSGAKITLGGNEYNFRAEKDPKAAALTGVFALESESTRALEHLLSTALAAKYAGRYEVLSTDSASVSEMSTVLAAYAEALDLHTSHIAGTEGTFGRGDEFTGGDYNYSTAIDLFSRGYALFYPGGTSSAADFDKSAPGFSANLDIIPMKLPLSDEQITAPGMTAEKLQSSIVIGSRYYIGINPKASETLSTGAKDFINWLTGEAGSKAYSNAFGTVPYNYSYIPSTDGSGSESDMSTGESSAPDLSTESESSSSGKMSKMGNKGKTGAAVKSETAENSSGSVSENSGTETEPNPETPLPGKPSHQTKTSLDSAVARYYAEGNWIPDMAASLPKDFAKDILGEGLSDFWGMETWTDKDRSNFVDTITEGWKKLIDKANTAVG